MIGLIGTFIVELVSFVNFYYVDKTYKNKKNWNIFVLQILNKGILELIGVEIGKGLDLPL